eukprot:7591374-Alexandrium_andersonii.AAC.1
MNSRFQDPRTGLNAALKILRGQQAAPVAYLRDSDGVLKTHPSELDRILTREWQRVYPGNGGQYEVAARFSVHYDEWVVKEQEAIVEQVHPGHLQAAFRRNGATAPGVDGWAP